jgi:hypothetical protein
MPRCRCRQEVQHHLDIGMRPRDAPGQRRDGVLRLLQRQPVAVQQPVHLLDRGDALARKAAPAQALGIEAAHRQGLPWPS